MASMADGSRPSAEGLTPSRASGIDIGIVLDFRLTPSYAGFGPICREVAAPPILRTTTRSSAHFAVTAAAPPAPRCIRPGDAVHRFAALGRWGLRAARYRTCHREDATPCHRVRPCQHRWRYAFP